METTNYELLYKFAMGCLATGNKVDAHPSRVRCSTPEDRIWRYELASRFPTKSPYSDIKVFYKEYSAFGPSIKEEIEIKDIEVDDYKGEMTLITVDGKRIHWSKGD